MGDEIFFSENTFFNYCQDHRIHMFQLQIKFSTFKIWQTLNLTKIKFFSGNSIFFLQNEKKNQSTESNINNQLTFAYKP